MTKPSDTAAYPALKTPWRLQQAFYESKRFFAGEPVDAFLQRQLEELVIGIKTRARAAARKPSARSLMREVQKGWQVKPLKLATRASDSCLRPYVPVDHWERMRPGPQQTVATIHIGYLGDDEWWDLQPIGADDLHMRASLSYGRLALTVRVPTAREADIPGLLREAAGLVRQVVNRQGQQLASFTETLADRAAPLIDRPLASEVRADVLDRLKNLDF